MRSAVVAACVLFWLTPLAASAEETSGDAVYQAECAKCHGADGSGDTPVGKAMKVSSLLDARFASPDAVAMIVKHIQTNGKHAAVKGKLSAEEIEAVAHAVQALAASSQPAE
jgi:mono/diheme cytochrome c family protein